MGIKQIIEKINNKKNSIKYNIKWKLEKIACSLGLHNWFYYDECSSRFCEHCNRTETFSKYEEKFVRIKDLDWEKRRELY